jgi:hypothetical protein
MIYSEESSKKRKSRKDSTGGFLYLPNIYLIIFQLILHTHSFFYKDKVLMFYSVVMAAIVAFAKLRKSLLPLVMSVSMEQLGH